MNKARRRTALGLVCVATLATMSVRGEAASARPSIGWTKFVSGSVTFNTDAVVAADAAGHVYVAGQWGRPATSSGGQVAVPSADSRAPGHDLFVAKFDGRGKVLWLRTLGGSHSIEFVRDITVLSDGRVALAATTESPDFPGTPLGSYHMGRGVGDGDGVVAVLSGKDGQVVWSRYLGHAQSDNAWGVAPAANGSVVVAGFGQEVAHDLAGTREAVEYSGFVAMFNREGDRQWLRTLRPAVRVNDAERRRGMTDTVVIRAVTVDRSGRVVITGQTDSPYLRFGRLPAEGRTTHGVGAQGFVAAYAKDGRPLWLRYLAGRGATVPESVAVARTGMVTVVGSTQARDFPTINGWQSRCRVSGNAYRDDTDAGFISVLSADGRSLTRSSCYGGSDGGHFKRVVITRTGVTLIGGVTLSTDFPTVRPVKGYARYTEGVLVTLDPSGKIRTATTLGGADDETATGLAAFPNGDAVLSGFTFSTDFPGASKTSLDQPMVPAGPVASSFITRLNAV